MITELLKMIEEVDPSDTAKLDEIDARVWCYLGLSAEPFKKLKYSSFIGRYWYDHSINDKGCRQIPPFYTRSRDALKAIRPDGWYIDINEYEKTTAFLTEFGGGFRQTKKVELPTEELAELHAILQALAYDRGQS